MLDMTCGMLDIEYNPYGATCYGLSQAAMTNWIADFLHRYQQLTSRDAVIYSTLDWWTPAPATQRRSGPQSALDRPLLLDPRHPARAGWGTYTFWQYSSTPIDQNKFNGAIDRLQALALG